ncbi:hypothetical protein METY_2834 [Methylopila sp. Yamaguchi]|nr:hypothetical protein METY_2834 [Methylopila sp. Yamaguchi]
MEPSDETAQSEAPTIGDRRKRLDRQPIRPPPIGGAGDGIFIAHKRKADVGLGDRVRRKPAVARVPGTGRVVSIATHLSGNLEAVRRSRRQVARARLRKKLQRLQDLARAPLGARP